jgi:gas vesicle protein
MNKLFSFLAGTMCGALVGATASLLLTPDSGKNLRAEATARWQEALSEARLAMVETQMELEAQFEQMKRA